MTKERISIIVPVYNCAEFLEECLGSIDNQKLDFNFLGSDDEDLIPLKKVGLELEVSIYDDASTDSSLELINKWAQNSGHLSIISKNQTSKPKGPGHARNRAVEQSTGQYLCFCDSDDIMEPERVIRQYRLAVKNPNAMVGTRFIRRPEDSSETYTYWANNLTQPQLKTQIYLTFGPSILLPTWFFHRGIYDRIPEGFDETGTSTPDDLIFLHRHLDNGGDLLQAVEPLVIYRYHQSSITFSISQQTIENIRLERLEREVLSKWDNFSIWNAGKRGRQFYRRLKPENQNKVKAFCDVDQIKIDQKTYNPHPAKVNIPIIHAQNVSPPMIICVKTELMWNESFRKILDSLNIIEGTDFFYFN